MAQSRHQDGRIRDRRVLGTFSTDENRRYRNDDRNRRFFVEPDSPVDFDYARGFANYVDMGDDEGDTTSLDNVLSWMRDHKRLLKEVGILDSKRSRLKMDFVGRRGTFKELLSAGGNTDADIELFVTLYRGTYYISQFWTPKDKSRQPSTRKHQMIAASSKLFLQFVTSKEGCEAGSYAPQNDNASYYAMMSALCGNHRMLFSSEVQAEGKDELKRLKTSPSNYLNIRTNGQAFLNPKKALKWWAPNALSGIPKIVCGLRDDKRKLVRSIKYMHTDSIPVQYPR
ncbi:decapping and exoribonuclease protein-like [Lytechinus pictus]|uniref:decapping and exoribonuclease protein-like n=1 Tax=Lytechinus pictus TaxID=7653 RepID=UPI0030B9B488